MGGPDRPEGRPRAAPICLCCGKTGHLSPSCTNAPDAKRSTPTDSADVIFDMTPWADEFAEWRRNQSMIEERGPGLLSGPQQEETEDVNGLEETKGWAYFPKAAGGLWGRAPQMARQAKKFFGCFLDIKEFCNKSM